MKLEPIKMRIKLPDGQEIIGIENYQEYVKEKGEVGPLVVIYAPGMGESTLLTFRNIKTEDTLNTLQTGPHYQFIVSLIKNKQYKNSDKPAIEFLQPLLSQNRLLKDNIIDMLMPEGAFTQKFLKLKENILHHLVKDFSVTEMQELIQVLIECGASYQHLLASPHSASMFVYYTAYFGRENLNKPILNSTLTITIVTVGSEKVLQKLQLAINAGVDVNATHQSYGTFLHVLTANEKSLAVLECMKVLTENETKKKCKFDYTIRDSEGKTLLLLAVKTNQTTIIQKLQEYHHQGKDVGVDIADNAGRTPLLLAAALGNKVAVQALLDMGANVTCVDKQGRGLNWYATAPKEEVIKILSSIHIEPNRDKYAPHNWLYFNDSLASTLVCDKSPDPEGRVLISRQEPHWKLIQDVLKAADSDLKAHINKKLNPLKNNEAITVIDYCMREQKSIPPLIYPHIKDQLLREACALGDLEQVKKLVRDGANVNGQDRLLRTPLHYAVMRQDLITPILKNSNSPRAIEQCMQEHVAVFKFLLEQNADLTIANKNGNNVRTIIERDNKDMEKTTALDKKIAQQLLHLLAAPNLADRFQHVAIID